MDSMSAFAMGAANAHRELMVFDWERAAQIIKERKPSRVEAGLRGDWEWTGGAIYANRAPVPKGDTYTYLASTWAVPEIDVDGKVSPCFRMQSETPNWDADTYWPEEALQILGVEA